VNDAAAHQLDEALPAAFTPALPPPVKKMRMENESAAEWNFVFGRNSILVLGKKVKPVHLKDPLGGSYTRNGKETSWRCSSKLKCPAIVSKDEGGYYTLYNNHSCPTKTHGPADVPAIPQHIQQHLSDSQEMLAQLMAIR
jgi:hypothetical protein